MNLEIQKIRLNELDSFVKSEIFSQLVTVPITPERAKSYISNPVAKPDDVVLYLGFVENNLVAFRTLFAGLANSETQQIHFGWCSGNWVHPDFRRKGYSQQLLEAAYFDWNKKLMFTNYAPNAEKVILKTGWFKPIHLFKGVRGYLFPKTRKLITKANCNHISKFIFSVVDILISVVSLVRILFYSKQTQNNNRFETLAIPDDECYLFNSKSQSDYLFKIDANKLKWVFNYPWISNSNKIFVEKYPFSSYSTSFYYKTVKIFIQNKFAGFFIFSVRGGHLKTLFFNIPDAIENEVALFLKRYCVQNKIEFISIYNSKIARQFFVQKFPFLYVKNYGQKIYSSFEINNNEKFHFQDGDGDAIFT